MNYKIIRETFLSYFESKKHMIATPIPLVNKEDPTLMFTNSGMNQFKNNFLNTKKPLYQRVANSQPCLRVSGKHNDLEEVGHDTYHHTLFEMLGNWSFGDYFKEKAIEYAWELLTKVYKIPKDKIYITVFKGDKDDNLHQDDETYKLWQKYTDKNKILFFGKKDNFWEMGATGPCGPCTEIHIDIRGHEESKKIDALDLVNKDHPEVIELWNLVFIEYSRLSDGSLEALPLKHIDTGMGFERLCMVLQKKTSAYDTDIFKGIIDKISKDANIEYTSSKKITDIAIRVISDHIRAISIAIAEGLLPSNNNEGYVIRRILRRASRYGFSYLNFKEPFLHKYVPLVLTQFEILLPNIKKQELNVIRVVKQEEESFLRTLKIGLDLLNEEISVSKGSTLLGDKVFKLYDTYGFPVDLTELIAKEKNFEIDKKGFEKCMKEQKERSKKKQSLDASDWKYSNHKTKDSIFVGYDTLETKSKILKYQYIANKNIYKLVLDPTPFYPEGGGQVGDTGVIYEIESNECKVLDTKRENGEIIHYVDNLPKDIEKLLNCKVHKERRSLISYNHTATHLLHAALVQLLGNHIQQKGSRIDEHTLRFDFSHNMKLGEDEIIKIENLINKKITENITIEKLRDIPKEQALKMGSKALFGEKYGDKVRVIIIDKNFSIELCGGTHAKNTIFLKYFKIISEASVSSGIRRIEAVTSLGALKYFKNGLSMLNQISIILKGPQNITLSVEQLLEEKNNLKKEIDFLHKKNLKSLREDLKLRAENIKGTNMIVKAINIDNPKFLKSLVFDLKKELSPSIIILASIIENVVVVVASISDTLIKTHNFHASEILQKFCSYIDGKGGGQPSFAMYKGKNTSGLNIFLQKIEMFIKNML